MKARLVGDDHGTGAWETPTGRRTRSLKEQKTFQLPYGSLSHNGIRKRNVFCSLAFIFVVGVCFFCATVP